MEFVGELDSHLGFGHIKYLARYSDQLSDGLKRVKHDVPGVPEERHVLVNRQLVEAVVTPAYLPLEVLSALVLPRVNAAVPRQVYLVVPILKSEAVLGLFKGKGLSGH